MWKTIWVVYYNRCYNEENRTLWLPAGNDGEYYQGANRKGVGYILWPEWEENESGQFCGGHGGRHGDGEDGLYGAQKDDGPGVLHFGVTMPFSD